MALLDFFLFQYYLPELPLGGEVHSDELVRLPEILDDLKIAIK
jgi:hypothetical protein